MITIYVKKLRSFFMKK